MVGNEELVHLPVELLAQRRNICSDHFDKKDFNKKGNRLRKRAYPKLKLSAPPLTDEQMKEFPQHLKSTCKYLCILFSSLFIYQTLSN